MAKQIRSTFYRDKVFQLISENDRFMVCDTETTGLRPDAQIIEFSAITTEMDKRNISLTEVDRIDRFIKPYTPVPKKVEEKTGITNKFLEDYPHETELFQEIMEYIERPGIFVGYNFKFDILKIDALYKRNHKELGKVEYIDVMNMAKDTIPADEIEDYKLATVAKYLGCDEGLQFHISIYDVIATMKIFVECLKRYVDQWKKEKEEGFKENVGRIISAVYYVNPYNRRMKRIIVRTAAGSFYYDTEKKGWGINTSAKSKVTDFDIDDLERKTELFLKVDSMDDAVNKLRSEYNVKQRLLKKPGTLKITSASYWAKGNKERIYIKTEAGDFFYDLLRKKWFDPWSSAVDTSNVNINEFENQLYAMYDAYSIEDLVLKMKRP